MASAKPTREQIVMYVQAATDQQHAFNLPLDFGLDFTYLDLSHLNLSGHYYVGFTNMFGSIDFSHANLSSSFLGSGNFGRANFTATNLEGAEFVTAELVGADFQSAKLDGVIFQECDLSQTNLADANLSTARINGSDFREADLTNAILAGATAEYGSTEYDGAKLVNADLSNMYLERASFKGADLSHANFQHANLKGADFSNAILEGTNFDGANLYGAKFSNNEGLSAETANHLSAQSQRWLFGLVDNLFGAQHRRARAILLLMLWSGLVCVSLVWSITRWLSRTHPRSAMTLLSMVTPAVAIMFSFGCFVLVFLIGGSSNVAQIAYPSYVDWWRFWYVLWPFNLLAVMLSLLLVLLPPYPESRPTTWLFKSITFLSLLLTLYHLLVYAPDA